MRKKLKLIRKSSLPTFSEMVGFDIELGPSVVVLTLKKKRKIAWVPFSLLCAAFLIRHGLSYATMHHVPCQAIYNLEGNLVAYIIYVDKGFETNTFTKEYGSSGYLRKIGFGDSFRDFREVFRESIMNGSGYGALGSEVEGWHYRTIPHSDARNN